MKPALLAHHSDRSLRGWRGALLGTLVPLAALLVLLPCAVLGQETPPTPEQFRAYGDMLRKYDNLFGVALQNFDDELRALRLKNATPGELQQAYDRFRNVSLELDRQYKQPVQEAMVAEANRRVGKFGTPAADLPDPRRPASPSTPIKASTGTGPRDPNYRPWGADLDAVGGARAVDHIGQVAHDMGLTADDGNRLFERKPAYSTTEMDRFDVTMHKAGPLDRVGSNAWQTQIEVDATLKETALHVNMRNDQAGRDYVAVRDHHSKARSGLQARGVDLLPGAGQGVNMEGAAKLQGMVKGTVKSLDVANLSDADLTRLIQKHGIGESPAKLRNVLNVLKSGMAITPDAAGLNADNIGKFQALCGDIIETSAQVTKTRATAELEERLALRDQLEATGDKADRERARQIREEIIDSRKRMQEVDRAVVRNEIDNLQQQRDDLARAGDDGKTKPHATPEAEAARKQKLAEIDREIDTRRAREALRDLYADVERRKSVRGTNVVADLERPRTPRLDKLSRVSVPDVPELPPTQRPGLLTNPVVNRGLMLGGGVIATYQGAKEEYYEAEQRIRNRLKGTPEANRRIPFNEVLGEISYTRTAGRTILSLTGVEGAWLAGQKAKYEFVKGTNDYIDAEIEREARIQRALGRPEDEISFGKTLQIAVKATIRQTTMTTYEGAKGVPILGDLVGAPENLFLVTESTIGIFYDRWKRDQILSANAEQAIQDARRASLTVEKLLRDMHNLIAAAQQQTVALESLRQHSLEAERQTELLRDQFRADFQALEAALSAAGTAPNTPPVLPDTAQIGKLLNEITTFLRESQEFAQRCDRLERDLNGGKIECSTIRALDRDLNDQLTALGDRRDSLAQAHAELQQLLQTLGPAADARQLALRLQSTAAYAGRVSEVLTRNANTVNQLANNLRTLRANLDLVRERVLSIHEKFSPRAAPADRADWDRYLHEADDARIDISAGSQAAAIAERLNSAAAHLGLLSRTELPSLAAPLEPRRIDGQLSGDLESLREPLAEMAKAYERAADKLDGLRQLCPLPKPEFTLTAQQTEGLNVLFEVEGPQLSPGVKRTYVWDFGDDTPSQPLPAPLSHAYAKPGQFTITVRVFEEKEQFSAQIGEARTSVVLKAPTTTAPVPRTPGQLVLSVRPLVTLNGERSLFNATTGKAQDPFLGDIPLGGFYGAHSLTFRHTPGTNVLEAVFQLGVRIKVRNQILVNVYSLDLEGLARGTIDPKSGNFRLQAEQITWKESYPEYYLEMGPLGVDHPRKPISPEDRAAMQSVVRGALGGIPTQIPWGGQISGTIDWKNFGGGQGRIELSSLFKGTWNLDAGHSYAIDWPEAIASLGTSSPQWRVYPSEDLAQQHFTMLSRIGGTPRPLPNLGSSAALLSGNRMAIVRFGRWHMQLIGSIPNDPARIREVLEALQKLIEDQNLETKFPAQSSQ